MIDQNMDPRSSRQIQVRPMRARRTLACIANAAAVALFPIVLAACSPDTSFGNLSNAVDMNDRSYYRGRDIQRINALGDTTTWGNYAGRFVWVEYAAPWCGICARQTPALRDIGSASTTVVTVMTSEMEGYGHPATRETAARWAARYGLDRANVIAADLTAMSVPRHLLFSPEGHTLFARAGFMEREEVAAVLDARRTDWERWKQTGTRAAWMR